MIVGIGIDLIDIRRIKHVLLKFGQRFCARILADSEMACLPENASQYLASRFAAKEATVKALGTGFASGINARQIAITYNTNGRPELYLYEEAKKRALELGAIHYHVSISHERNYAVAVVILED